MENIGSNLSSPAGDGVGAFDSGQFLLAFFLFQLPEFGLQQLEGDLPVLLLITLTLGFDDDAGRKMFDPNGGANFVDILAAGTGRAAGFKLKVLIADDDGAGFFDDRHDLDAGKGGLAGIG